MNYKLRILVCSDFHAFDGKQHRDGDPPSIYDISRPGSECPLERLVTFLKKDGIHANIVVFPGDLADKACPTSLRAGWKMLQQLKESAEATVLVATAGNHDLDSRYQHNAYDAKGAIQALTPLFPIDDEQKFNEYWARHVCFEEGDCWRICLLNSAAYHGAKEEHKLGRISQATLDYLSAKLQGLTPKDINVLVCHHPPHDQSENQQGSGDRLHFGDDLVAMLASGQYGRWIIIFGHKHYPNIEYARGGDSAPILISSASLTGMPYAQYGPDGVNQFHILDFDSALIDKFGLVFRVESYQWSVLDRSWKPSGYQGGLPKVDGIGFRVSPEVACNNVSSALSDQNDIAWKDLLIKMPELCFIPLKSIWSILRMLESKYGIIPEFADEPYASKILRLVKA